MDEKTPTRRPEDEPTLALSAEPMGAMPIVMARAVNFCNRCGTRFADDWSECIVCAAQHPPAAVAAVVSSTQPEDDGIRPVKSAIALYFAQLAISIISMIYLLSSKKDGAHINNAEIAAEIGLSIVTIIWAFRARRSIATLFTHLGPLWVYVAAPVLAAVTFIVASLVVAALHKYLQVPKLDYTDNLKTAGYGFGFAILLICVQPAIFEELAFRGVMLTALDRVLTRPEAAIVVAFLFGILHLSVPSLLHLTLLGLLLAWLRRRAGSLYPCMLMHFTHNLLVLLNERYGWSPW